MEVDAVWQLGRSRYGIPTLAMLLASSGVAGAEKPATDTPRVLDSKLLTKLDKPRSDKRQWFGRHFRTAKGHGFEYRRSFRMGRDKRRMVFSIQGPLVKKKTPGLGIEIRF